MTAWAEYLVELHRVKDIAYGDAWCRRGEAVGIFPNIARKYDRRERLRLDSGSYPEGAVEPVEDTLADLLIYAVKYVRWLRDRDPETARALPASIQARSEVADLILLVTELPRVESPDEELASAFKILESTFKAEANPDSAERARAAWMLARSAWSELRELPVPTHAQQGTASVLTFEATRTTDDLEDQLLTAFSASPGRILLLGMTPTAIRLKARLSSLHLGQWVVGIAEPGRPQNAEVGAVDWAKAAAEPISYLVVTDDAAKEDLLLGYVSTSQSTEQLPTVILSGTAHLEFRDALYTELDAPALVPSYATGYRYTRVHIFQYLRAAAQSGLAGAIVEFGAFKGGTTAWLARTAKRLGLSQFPGQRKLLLTSSSVQAWLASRPRTK